MKKIEKKKIQKISKVFFIFFFFRRPGLKICWTSGLDVMSGRALAQLSWLKDFSVLFLFYFRWRCFCFANRKCNPQWHRTLCLWSQYRSSVKIVSQIVCFDWYIGSTSTSSRIRWTHVCIFYLIWFLIYRTSLSVISICKCQYQYLVLKTIFVSNQILKYYSLLCMYAQQWILFWSFQSGHINLQIICILQIFKFAIFKVCLE
jgi:hypothetical protein